MGSLLRRVASFVGVGILMVIFDKVVPRRRVGRLLALARPAPTSDRVTLERVRRVVGKTATQPHLIHATVEHGCVELRGPVVTRERARLVRAIAGVSGVDSIVDLMTEPSGATRELVRSHA